MSIFKRQIELGLKENLKVINNNEETFAYFVVETEINHYKLYFMAKPNVNEQIENRIRRLHRASIYHQLIETEYVFRDGEIDLYHSVSNSLLYGNVFSTNEMKLIVLGMRLRVK